MLTLSANMMGKYITIAKELFEVSSSMKAFRLILSEMSFGVVQCAADEVGTIEYLNNKAAKIMDCQHDNFKNKEFTSLVAGQELTAVVGFIQLLLQTDEPVNFDFNLQNSVAQECRIACTGLRLQNARLGSIVIVVLEQQQGIGQKHVDNELDVSRYTTGSVLVCDYETKMTIMAANERFCKFTGYSQQEIIGQNFIDFVKSEYREGLFADIDSQCQEEQEYQVEYKLNAKDGRVLCVVEQGRVALNNSGRRLLKGIIFDISKQKETEESLRVIEKRYEVAMQFSDVSIFEYDIQSGSMFVHEKDKINYGMSEVVENSLEYLLNNVIAPQSRADFLEMYERVHNGAAYASARVWTKNTTGEEHLLEVRLVTVFDAKGNPVKAVGMRHDITDIVALQKEQKYSNSLATELSFAYEANITSNKLVEINEKLLAKMGCSGEESFSELIEKICTNLVEEKYHQNFMYAFDKQHIIAEYESGRLTVNIEFLQKDSKGGEADKWYDKNINIIRDDLTGEYMVRCYMNDITEHKRKEQKLSLERRYYEAILSKTAIVYEANITKNLTVPDCEAWSTIVGEAMGNDYNQIVAYFSKKFVHPEDQIKFFNVFYSKNLLREFYNKKLEHSCDYRLLDRHEEWRWVRCNLYLFEDPLSADVCGFSYVEKIDEEKKRELDLIYRSQYDMLSGLYNRTTLQDKIDEYLLFEGRYGKHVMFMVDIDYFKAINDNFGHVFGDAVISEVADKIKSIFRDFDLLGRVGGDEFIIFMKDVPNIELAASKANKICEILQESYTKNGIKYGISASVGIAYYGEHGQNYYDLYNNADSALYKAKNLGRNQFFVYNGEEIPPAVAVDRHLETAIISKGRKFENNVCAYVVRILYDASDYNFAINSVLELLGKHYNVSRVYIFETFTKGEDIVISNTFEWCNNGIEPQINNLQNLTSSEIGDYVSNFDAEGIFYMPDVSLAREEVREILAVQGIKSMVQIAWTKNGNCIGFIGFDDCRGALSLTPEQLWDYRNVSNLLGVFLTEMRNREKQDEIKNTTLSLVNSLDSYAYVCNPLTYKVMFMNKKTQELAPDANIGDFCYKSFWNKLAPCEDCPMYRLVESGQEYYVNEMHNYNLDVWVRASTSWVDWLNDEKACLVNSVDITKYKK